MELGPPHMGDLLISGSIPYVFKHHLGLMKTAAAVKSSRELYIFTLR